MHAHQVEVTRSTNDNPDVPDTFHVTCSCGWAAAVHDGLLAQVLAGEHLERPELPAPASPTPNTLSAVPPK